ncbi:MAG: CocE/NonD family hydrolase, partial [Crocinitomicaceae bacterium]|nr:CocE/NonD family hydrolase [Crocinitomicaceae bacterium]
YDVCAWISDQIWHRDRIGTWGPSALGGVQYSTAREQHPNHTCAVPLVAHPQQSYSSYFYGGVLEEARLEQLDALGYGLSPIIMANTYYNATWQFSESTTWYPSDIQIPTLQIGGWYDHTIDKMLDWYEATRSLAGVTVQDQQWLLIGPWVHGGTGAAYVGSSLQGELTYPNAEFVSDTMASDFFQYYLLDTMNNWENTDLITYYEMGNDVWLTSNATNIEALTTNKIYLDATNKLRAQVGSYSTSFVSDPNNPAPTIGGATLHTMLDQGPYDQISLESRNDIITFSSGDLPGDVTTTGRIKLNLFVETDQPDCDIIVHLVDVYPDGRNMLITDGARRMRFRNGYTQADEAFMTPGQIYPVEIELPFTNYTWLTGHKIKVYIGANSSIRWNVNLQDGGTMYQPGTGNVANITIHHNAGYPSSITLPGNNPLLGHQEIDPNNFQVFPNPVNDLLNFTTQADFSPFEICDLSGRILQSGLLDNKHINVESLTTGVYFVRLPEGSTWCQTKFTKR